MTKATVRNTSLKLMLIAAVLGLIFAFWYTRPVPQYTAAVLCSQEGEQVSVVIDITWYRHLFKPTDIRGTVTVDGKVYRSLNTSSNQGFLEDLKEKFRSGSPSFLFTSSPDGTRWNLSSVDWLRLEHSGMDLSQPDSKGICISVSLHGQRSGNMYFGPAKTAEEARAILARQFGMTNNETPAPDNTGETSENNISGGEM